MNLPELISCDKLLPDYLHDDLTLIVGNLCDEVLGKEKTKATAEWKE